MVQDKGCDIRVAAISGRVQRSKSAQVSGHQIGAARDQRFGDHDLARQRRCNQRCFFVAPALVDGDAVDEVSLHGSHVTAGRRVEQWTGLGRPECVCDNGYCNYPTQQCAISHWIPRYRIKQRLATKA